MREFLGPCPRMRERRKGWAAALITTSWLRVWRDLLPPTPTPSAMPACACRPCAKVNPSPLELLLPVRPNHTVQCQHVLLEMSEPEFCLGCLASVFDEIDCAVLSWFVWALMLQIHWLHLSCLGERESIYLFACLFVFRDRVSLLSPGYSGTHFEDQGGLELRDLPACATTTQPNIRPLLLALAFYSNCIWPPPNYFV